MRVVAPHGSPARLARSRYWARRRRTHFAGDAAAVLAPRHRAGEKRGSSGTKCDNAEMACAQGVRWQVGKAKRRQAPRAGRRRRLELDQARRWPGRAPPPEKARPCSEVVVDVCWRPRRAARSRSRSSGSGARKELVAARRESARGVRRYLFCPWEASASCVLTRRTSIPEAG